MPDSPETKKPSGLQKAAAVASFAAITGAPEVFHPQEASAQTPTKTPIPALQTEIAGNEATSVAVHATKTAIAQKPASRLQEAVTPTPTETTGLNSQIPGIEIPNMELPKVDIDPQRAKRAAVGGLLGLMVSVLGYLGIKTGAIKALLNFPRNLRRKALEDLGRDDSEQDQISTPPDIQDRFADTIHQGFYNEAVELAQRTGRISVSLVQRRLEVNFSEAQKLVNELKQNGVVSETGGYNEPPT